ncbi:MAG: holo-ACP synthase [Armatimonadota bacterium]|nr:holo-ACP synthase [Armatimonadota bacterium]
MVDGIGTDIVETARVERAIQRTRGFLQRVFTETEISYCQKHTAQQYQHFAGRFAAKEAVIKALGRGVPWRDIEITNDERGKPLCTLHGKAAEVAAGRRILVSISHCEAYSTACAVALEPA